MYINEAVELAQKLGMAIRRRDTLLKKTIIVPTNTRDCCLILGGGDAQPPVAPRWNPCLDDLTSDKWEVVTHGNGDNLRKHDWTPVDGYDLCVHYADNIPVSATYTRHT